MLEGESQVSGEIIDPVENSSFFIGVRQDLEQHFSGRIRNVSIWNNLSANKCLYIILVDFTSSETGLVGYWDFSYGSGSVLFDQTSNENNGIINGAAWVEEVSQNGSASGLVSDNYSLNFDGSSDYINCGISEDYNFSQFTAEAWISVEGVSNYNQTIIAKSDNGNSEEFILEIWRDQNSRKVGFGINSRQDNQEFVATENIIEYGQWIHVAGVYDGDSLKIYIDGQKHVAELADVTFNNYNNSLFIGKANNNNNSKFGGKMDEVRLWNYARTTEQILSNMNYELSGLEQGLVAYWDFNEGTGGVLEDKSVNENNATIVGAEWTSESPSLYNSNGLALGTSYTPGENLDDNTEYFWQVMASDLSGATYTTPLQSFIVNAGDDAPSEFSLSYPDNASMIVDLTPTLSWEESLHPDQSSYIEKYEVYIHTEESFDGVSPIDVLTNSLAISSSLNEDELYFWKVVAVDEGGDETSSATWSFWTNNMNSAPAAFTLISPEQDEETGLTPTFSWNESSDADLYDEITYTLNYGTFIQLN